jgi:hypothetical protein
VELILADDTLWRKISSGVDAAGWVVYVSLDMDV